ncbi:MAG: ATP cone domain-containing protein [bacterium]
MNSSVHILKADGSRQAFRPEKLVYSLKRIGADDAVIEKIVAHIQGEIVEGVTTNDIYHHAFNLLRQHQKPVAAKYSLRRALAGLGPTGFPFEKFVAEVFRAKGYTAETDQTVRGACVPHEVDVVAYKDDGVPASVSTEAALSGPDLIMCELKFHNEVGFKTDLKVALYVKARFDDLRSQTFEYGGKKRPFGEGWLVTNTKFTQTAIDYGRCAGLKMIGWNYPEKENLEEWIEESGLHPLTCISTLTDSHRQELFRRGIVLCKTLIADPSILTSMGLSTSKIAEVKEELESVC